MQERIFKSTRIFINIKLKFFNMLCETVYRSPTNVAKNENSFFQPKKIWVRKLPQNNTSHITEGFNCNFANYDNQRDGIVIRASTLQPVDLWLIPLVELY